MVQLVPTIRLNSGHDMPTIGLGTFKGKLAVKLSSEGQQRTTGEVEQAVRDAIDAGYRHIDCALLYDNEEEIGDALRAKIEEGVIKREDMFITSKLWNTMHRPALVESACKLSLKRLGLDYLDLYLIHWPTGYKEGEIHFPTDENGKLIYEVRHDLVEVWKAMEDLVAKGLVKSIGVSNWNSAQLDRTVKNAKIIPAVNQIEISPYNSQKKLVKVCKDLGIAVTAYSPFGNPGRWSNTDGKSMLDDPVLIAVGKKHNKNSAQVILRYLIQREIAPLPKSVTKQRIIDNFNVFDFQLSPEEMAQIEGLNQNKRTVLFEEGMNHPEYPFHIE